MVQAEEILSWSRNGASFPHLVGDYLMQSYWMATEKVKRWSPALVHGATHGLPFPLITQSPFDLTVIVVTHIVLDRTRAAKYPVRVRNLLVLTLRRGRGDVQRNQGSPVAVPSGPANVLVLAAGKAVHLAINAAALAWWAAADDPVSGSPGPSACGWPFVPRRSPRPVRRVPRGGEDLLLQLTDQAGEPSDVCRGAEAGGFPSRLPRSSETVCVAL
ncbi:hypothetical protein [Streptomyces sp. NPDC055299]